MDKHNKVWFLNDDNILKSGYVISSKRKHVFTINEKPIYITFCRIKDSNHQKYSVNKKHLYASKEACLEANFLKLHHTKKEWFAWLNTPERMVQLLYNRRYLSDNAYAAIEKRAKEFGIKLDI